MFVFGSGVLIGTPAATAAIPNPTPINFGLAQEVSLDISTTTKALYGQYNFPVAIGAGTKKMTGKAKMARISGQALGALFFGITPLAGSTQTVYGESAGATTPTSYAVTNAAHFVADLGVVYSSSGLPLTLTTSAPSTGQYEVNATTGVYTFAAGDSANPVLVSYRYTASTVGESIQVPWQLVGPSATFSANLFAADPTTGKKFSMFLYNCVAAKLSFLTKLEDFVVPEFDFQCFANAAGQVCQFNFGDAA
jgi:hypothetical protein